MATTNKAIVSDLPLVISSSIPTALARYSREDFAAAYAIGNTPWLSAASDQNRISRITTTYQKERIDQSSAAGEQSLSNWWIRSANSWHHGAGERYYDADTSDTYRFYESNNVDPWTIGEVKLLPLTTKHSSVSASNPVNVGNGVFYLANTSLHFYNGSTGVSSTITMPVGSTPQKITSDGTYCIVGASDGIYDVTTAGVVRKLYDLPNYAGTPVTCQAIAYVKDRLIIAFLEGTAEVGVYEVSREYTTPTHRIDANDERWETKSTSVVVNSISELPSAVIVGYTEGVVSRIQAYTINPTSPLAAINDPTIIAELPRGETLNQIRTYLNEYVVLATSKGLRVGTIGTDGQSFTYGPLNVEGEVKDITFDDRYVYGTRSTLIDSTAGLWRFDLGQAVSDGYAYAADLVTDSALPVGVSLIGATGRKFITSSSGTWIESATTKALTGWIRSGWIRWGTSERKQPVSISIRTQEDSNSTVGFTLNDADNVNTVTIDSIPLGINTEIGVSAALQPSDLYDLKFNLSRATSNTTGTGPVLEQWQIKALPAPIRSRTLTIPLLCFEEERDPNGITRVSNPWQRIQYLERIEQNGGAVLYQDFASGEERICVIRAIQFEQTSPPTWASGFGGIVTIQLQTIDTEQAIQ